MSDLEDRAAVIDLVQTERAARDQGQWDRMAACYHADSAVSISWIETTGPDFVAASKTAFANGICHLHRMSPTLVTLNGTRALAETGCVILLPGKIDGVTVTVSADARLFARAEKRGVWRLTRLAGLYLTDNWQFETGARPQIDHARLAAYRAPYRHLSYLLAESGKQARADLPGLDRPDLCEMLYRAEGAWLAGDR
ncbi:MAG: nuclear transport factor 2 family protein [Micropepsaceae bacterium]